MSTLDELIARDLAEAQASGELRGAPSWGRPLAFDDGWDETPTELRLPFKVLKEAGFVPHEVVMLRELAGLRERLAVLGGDVRVTSTPGGGATVCGRVPLRALQGAAP